MIVPMFPLPGAFLFPNAIMPLHVFEPRYVRMIDDLLDTAGRFVVATLTGETDESDRPAVEPVAGLGEITRHERLEDGRYIVVVQGLGRVRIHERASDRPYRLVDVSPLPETPVPDAESADLRDRLARAVRARASNPIEIPEDLAIEILTDLLLMQLTLPPTRMSELFAAEDVALRAREALAEHGRRGP